MLSGTASELGVGRGRSRDLRALNEGVDCRGGGFVVKFSKRERSDDTGLMDDSSVAWSSLAMAAGLMMAQYRRWLWLRFVAADRNLVENARRQPVGAGSCGPETMDAGGMRVGRWTDVEGQKGVARE